MHKLYFGDGLEVLREFESDSIELVSTEPKFHKILTYI